MESEITNKDLKVIKEIKKASDDFLKKINKEPEECGAQEEKILLTDPISGETHLSSYWRM